MDKWNIHCIADLVYWSMLHESTYPEDMFLKNLLAFSVWHNDSSRYLEESWSEIDDNSVDDWIIKQLDWLPIDYSSPLIGRYSSTGPIMICRYHWYPRTNRLKNFVANKLRELESK